MESPPFQVDDRVLCHQENGDTYEGVVRNAKYDLPLWADSSGVGGGGVGGGATTTTKTAVVGGGRWSFFIHFNGWNARHDKWVAADRILKKQQQQQHHHGDLQQQQQQNRKRTLSDDDSDDHNNNNNNDNDIENDNRQAPSPPSQRPRKKRVLPFTDQQLTLPFTLKTVLVEEMECITLRHYRHQLPAAVPIRKVLNHLRKKHGRHNNDDNIQAVDAFCQNLVDIFHQALPKCLLYTQERTQFADWSLSNHHHNNDPTKSWVDVCGCEYLLRLVVQLPASHLLLTTTSTTTTGGSSTTTTNTNHYYWSELLVLMQKNKAALFPTTLVSAALPHANYYYHQCYQHHPAT